jgi:cob(I)alamin adenosyltransferase
MNPLRHKLITTDADAGHQRSFVVRPNTPLGQLLTVARADTRRAETPAVALEALAAVLELETFLERTTDDLALAARRDGATWEQIGSALGTSRQAAQQRWANISRFAGWEATVTVDH